MSAHPQVEKPEPVRQSSEEKSEEEFEDGGETMNSEYEQDILVYCNIWAHCSINNNGSM